MDYRKAFRIEPDSKVKLAKIDPADTGKLSSEESVKEDTQAYGLKLAKQQTLLYAEHKHSILVVLQALDAAGKDGTIKHVFSVVNPQGVSVVGFKQPTPLELAHDFLWRVHPHAPGKGEIAIFNRSHYEDVLVTRVHKLIDKETWTERIKRIRDFEQLLAENGTTILKFFLHISKDEQTRAVRPAPGGPAPQLEDQRVRLFRTRAVGRLHRGVRGRDRGDERQGRAVVRGPGQPQVVPQSRGVADHGRHDGRPEARLPQADRRPRRHPAEVPRGAERGKRRQEERLRDAGLTRACVGGANLPVTP